MYDFVNCSSQVHLEKSLMLICKLCFMAMDGSLRRLPVDIAKFHGDKAFTVGSFDRGIKCTRCAV